MTANALHPGFVATNFFSQGAYGEAWAMRVAASLFAISPEEGARTSIYLASSEAMSRASPGVYSL